MDLLGVLHCKDAGHDRPFPSFHCLLRNQLRQRLHCTQEHSSIGHAEKRVGNPFPNKRCACNNPVNPNMQQQNVQKTRKERSSREVH